MTVRLTFSWTTESIVKQATASTSQLAESLVAPTDREILNTTAKALQALLGYPRTSLHWQAEAECSG